jgi:hypothetical protein
MGTGLCLRGGEPEGGPADDARFGSVAKLATFPEAGGNLSFGRLSMCTVTFMPRATGYCLAMNRDEQRARPAGLPPKKYQRNGRQAVGPSEPGGGTWINLNDQGTTLALINWYSIPERVSMGAVSRGAIIQALRWADTPEEVEAGLESHPLKRTNPCRLIGDFPRAGKVIEWQWDLKELKRIEHPWRLSIWISSGHDEAGAQRMRMRSFKKACRQASAGTLDWLRRLHRSHKPRCGPYSICMHRNDAVTVSYTEIAVTMRSGTLRYTGHAPCLGLRSGCPTLDVRCWAFDVRCFNSCPHHSPAGAISFMPPPYPGH